MMQAFAKDLARKFSCVEREGQLYDSLSFAAGRMGFDHFALTYDRRCKSGEGSLLIHDYPADWARVYEAFNLGGTDPIRRASEHSMIGFEWSKISSYIPLMRGDRRMLAIGREHGIADGFTVPRHLPGEASGTCTFAISPDSVMPSDMLVIAEIVGGLALVSAQRLMRGLPTEPRPLLTERQRECLLWWARGRSAAEIAIILGICEDTVAQHLKSSRERYGVHSRQGLILCALYDGLIGFGDVIEWWNAE